MPDCKGKAPRCSWHVPGYDDKVVVEGRIATGRGWLIMRPLLRMKKLGRFFLVGFLLFSPAGWLAAQSDDPSEIFLKAYMTSQQGEKLEHDNQFNAALAKYRFAGSLLEDLRKRHPEWQPAIVDYRSRKVAENILRVQDKASTQTDLAAGTTPLPGGAPVLPEQAAGPGPAVEVVTPRQEPSAAPARSPVARSSPAAAQSPVAQSSPPAVPPPVVNEAAVREATKKLQSKVDDLQGELEKSRTRSSSIEKDKDTLNSRLEETNSKLAKAQSELDKSKAAERKIRDQLTQAQESVKKAPAGTSDSKAQEALRAEIVELKKALAGMEQGRSAAEKERDQANAKAAQAEKDVVNLGKERDEAKTKAAQAGSQVASITKERDVALAQLKGITGNEKRIQVLLAENSDLKQKLADAEKAARDLSEDKPKKEKELADLKQQIGQLQRQLVASQKQNQDSESKVAGLRSQLDEATSQLEHAKLTGITAEETARLTKENQVLRNIVIRERQEEARRDQAKKLMLAEFEKLKIKSDTLTEQIELLAQPVTKLNDEELALLRQPIVSISDNNPAAVNASFAFAKKTTATTGKAPSSDQAEKAGGERSGVMASGQDSSDVKGFAPLVPDNLVPLARDAKESFDHGKYRTAEKKYQEILTKSPNNLYSLSNLGVVYFRTGKLKAAELTLKKAVALAPKDEFSHTTLGIVYYRQSKYDDALTELTRALGINPKSATAHNYLGITASQKGWQEAAEKEMLEAIAQNPDYADAHFNLAVIYATSQPPAKELAKRYYARATSLGAQPDPSLEKLLH
ncbi:MAG: hypothetical protein QOH39_301 [Verrucomicrobiota bacterium]|jgi:Flp pilus assembly protein TadD/predicted  nucleic acid-binding Zn-ribbon protein